MVLFLIVTAYLILKVYWWTCIENNYLFEGIDDNFVSFKSWSFVSKLVNLKYFCPPLQLYLCLSIHMSLCLFILKYKFCVILTCIPNPGRLFKQGFELLWIAFSYTRVQNSSMTVQNIEIWVYISNSKTPF